MTPPDRHTLSTSRSEVTATVSAQSADTRALGYLQRNPPAEAAESSAPPPEVGTRVGPYVIQEKLGEGVSCHVFRGWDATRSCPVALKVLNWANVYDRPAAMKQLRTEALSLSRVKHPQVVRFLDAWVAGQDRLRVEVTGKPDGVRGFEPLEKRWVVGQTFARPIESRRLVRDYERLPGTSAATVKSSGSHRMARRARPPRGKRKFRFERKPAP